MKTAVCCIIKQENLYLRDFIEYHKNIGFDNVILYDNNDEKGEYPQQVIGDHIRSGFVIYEDCRGKYPYQLEAYGKCYSKYATQFDWIAFIDCDEFIEITSGMKIHEYLSQSCFDKALVIPLYWLSYGDNGLLHYDKRPVYERFLIPKDPYLTNFHVFKFIIKCYKELKITFEDSNHFKWELTKSTPNFCSNTILANGEFKDDSKRLYDMCCYEGAYLKHYHTLTIDEFLTRRLGRRTYADGLSITKERILGIFWEFNEKTPEKEKIIDDFLDYYKIFEEINDKK